MCIRDRCSSGNPWSWLKIDHKSHKLPPAQPDIPHRLPTANLPPATGGFALKIADQTITIDQIITARLIERLRPLAQKNDFGKFKEKAKPLLNRILTNKIANILLYQQAKREAPADIDKTLEKAVQAEVRRFVAQYGGNVAAAEAALKEEGMDWQSFKEHAKRTILTQSYIASQLPPNRPITYSQLVNYYNQMAENFANPAIVKFELLDIHIDRIKVTDPNQSRETCARILADKLIKQINEGKDFITLAKEYPEITFIDHSNGIAPENLVAPYDILVPAIEKMQDSRKAGSQPGNQAHLIETDDHIFIVKLQEKRAKSFEPLEKVQHEIETRIIRARRRKAINKLNKLTRELAKQVAFSEKELFIDLALKEIYRLSRAPARQGPNQ